MRLLYLTHTFARLRTMQSIIIILAQIQIHAVEPLNKDTFGTSHFVERLSSFRGDFL